MAARALIERGALRRRAAITLALVHAAIAFASPPTIEWHPSSDGGREGEGALIVAPLDPELAAATVAHVAERGCGELLRVVARPSGSSLGIDDLPPLWGDCASDGERLLFRPRHPRGQGTELVARFASRALGLDRPAIESAIAAREPAPATTVVTGAWPSGETLAANTLRLYVEFSAPMSITGIDRFVRLEDARGTSIADAFVAVPGGLWDRERRRLTLFVHPGRVKSGVGIGEAMGPVLRSGDEVRLVVEAGARDADGRTLGRRFERSWRVAAPIAAALAPEEWVVVAPAAPADPLTVALPVPLDRALASSALEVVDAEGEPVAGRLELGIGERSLRFAPRSPWRESERYTLRIAAILEDPCGNRIGRRFERAHDETSAARGAALAFTPRFVVAASATAP